MANMPPEFLIDQVQNVNVQGPLVTVTYGRIVRTEGDKDDEATNSINERVQVTMTTPNFLNTVNALGQIAKRIVDSKKISDSADEENQETDTDNDKE
jgi:hypothetical protein